jgi:ABC-type uncharacterized transport system permease subunit
MCRSDFVSGPGSSWAREVALRFTAKHECGDRQRPWPSRFGVARCAVPSGGVLLLILVLLIILYLFYWVFGRLI